MASSKKFALVGVLALGCLFWTALTPQQIVVNAGVFGGFADRDLEQSDVYLLATIAGVAINPANILSNAAGFGAYSDRQLQEAQTYLLSQINTTGGGIPGLYVTGTGTGTTNGDKTITINVTASGSGLPGTNTVVAYGGDPATASQTQWLAVANGTTYDTNKAGNSVILSNGNVSAVTFSLPSSGGKIQGQTVGSTNLFTVANASTQPVIQASTNGIVNLGTNNQGVLFTDGSLYLAGIAHSIFGLHVDWGNVTNNIVYTNPIFAGNITQTNGTLLETNSTGAGKDWALLSGGQLSLSNGTFATQATLNSTNLSLAGAAINAGISFGGGNGLSNSAFTAGGSNDIAIRAGYQTNNAQFTNGNFYLLDAAFFRNTLGILGAVFTTNGLNVGTTFEAGGQSFLSNSVVVTAGGANITGMITNTQTTTCATNAWNWYWDVSRPFLTFNVSSNNPNLNGFSNLASINNGGANVTLVLSNQAGANATLAIPAGCVIMGAYESNQPLTTLVITNGKKMQIDLTIIPNWTTNLKVWQQKN